MKPKRIQIDNALIASLNPCKNRHDNYLSHYKGRSFNMPSFLNLKHISHEDKLWVFFRVLKQDAIRFVAADFAAEVLHIYEAKYPADNRVRNCIEAVQNPASTAEEIYRAGGDAAASVASAYAAASAASAYAAYAAAASAYASAYASYAYAAASAAYASAYAAYRKYGGMEETMQAKQIKIMKKWWKKVGAR